MKSTLLPPNILRCLSSADRKSLGKAGLLPEEALASAQVKSERDLHKLVRGLLDLRGIEYFESRMDKRTTQKKGVPDFVFAVRAEIYREIEGNPIHWWREVVPCAYECKFGKGLLSEEQTAMLKRLQTHPNNWRCRVIRSVDDALEDLRQLGL